MSIKVLAFGDAGQPTGFERVFRGNLDALVDTGKYDIVGIGFGFNGNPDMAYKYPVYSANTRNDYFSFEDLPKLVQRHKPDVIWIVQDLWNLTQMAPFKPVDLPMIGYFPVDTPNMKWSYAISCGAMAAPVAYTHYGARETAAGVQSAIDILVEGIDRKQLSMDEPRSWLSLPHGPGTKQNIRLDYLAKWQNLSNWNVIPHGLDKGKFSPMDKREARGKLGFPADEFLIGYISANQFRKRQDILLRSFAVMVERAPNARLVFWCHAYDERGWDLEQLARYYGVFDKVYFIHKQTEYLSDQELNFLYSSLDVHVNTSGGEGFGLTSLESAACGVPQMVPDWSATREIWGEHGMLIPVDDYRMEPKFLNTAHAICSVEKLAKMLLDVYENRDKLQEWGTKALDLATNYPTWTDTGAAFDLLIQRVLASNFPAQPLSFNDILRMRKEKVLSELEFKPLLK